MNKLNFMLLMSSHGFLNSEKNVKFPQKEEEYLVSSDVAGEKKRTPQN